MMSYGPIEKESKTYRDLREKLREAEIALRDQREKVAELRRRLPRDTGIPDYELVDSGNLSPRNADQHVHLSDLFEDPSKPLVVYQFMYGGAQSEPCPMCSMWIDGFNGVARHLGPRMSFAVIAEAAPDQLRDWASKRGWDAVPLLSSGGSSFKRDLHFEDGEKVQHPGLSVFLRDPEQGIRHFYSVSAYPDANEYRGVDLYTPVWHLLDLTPEGRGDWMPELEYR